MNCFPLRDNRAPAWGAGKLRLALLTAFLGIVLALPRAAGATALAGDWDGARATVEAFAPKPQEQRTPNAPGDDLHAEHGDDADAPTSAEAWSYVVIRWWTFGAIVTLLGAVFFANVVAPAVRREAPPALSAELDRGVRLVGVVASIAVVVGAVARVTAQRAMLRETVGTESAIVLGDVLSGMFGVGVAVQLAGGVAGLLAFAGAWGGTLLLLAAVGIPAALRHSGNDPRAAVLTMLRFFSPVALGSTTLLAVTGLYASWVHLASFDALRTTRYGHALLLKLALVVTMIVAGAINWRRLGPSAGTAIGARRLSRSAWLELAIAAMTLLVTAVLVARPTPADMMP